MFVILFAPVLIRLEQFPYPYHRPFPLDAALLEEVPDNVHLAPVFVGSVQDRGGDLQAFFPPDAGPLKKPGPQFFFKVFVLPFLCYAGSKGYQLN
jgi:hypothetical protein